MTTFTSIPKEIPKQIEDALAQRSAATSRRDFLKTSGVFVVSFGAAAVSGASPLLVAAQGEAAATQAVGPYPDPDFRQLDSWIVIHENNTATFFVGKTDCGQGTGTAFRQMMSDELDIAYDDTDVIMGSTDVTPDQGGSGGSDAIQRDGWPMRRVAAEARRVLLELASERFGVPVEELNVSDAVITLKSDPSKRITYAELIDGKPFHVTLTGERQRDHRHSRGQAGARAPERRPVSRALRHSTQGGRVADMGGGCQASRNGACTQRQAAGRRRETHQHRRDFRQGSARIHPSGQQRQLCGGGL